MPLNFPSIMIFRRQTRRRGLSTDLLSIWDRVPLLSLPANKRDSYERRETAIRLYAAGESVSEINKRTGVTKQQLYGLVDRCLAYDLDGTQYGFRALIPWLHTCTTKRSSQDKLIARVPQPGVLQALFDKYPDIYSAMKAAAVKGIRHDTKAAEKNMPMAAIHEYFIGLCIRAGIRGPHYPFSPDSESEGEPAIRRWTAKVRQENALKSQSAKGREDGTRRPTSSGPENRCARVRLRLYKQVELDGHKIDAPLSVEVPSPTGQGTVWRQINRIWIIAIVLRSGGACIGYSYATGTNYSGWDVIRATQNSLRPWKKRKLKIDTIDYRPGDGMPSGAIPELAFACWDETWLDNHMGHRARNVLSQCERMTQAIPVFSPVGSPNTHPWVEGFFTLLEEAGIHRLPNTTGSNPKDLRRSAKHMERYHLTLDQLEDLIDLLVCRINGSRCPGTSQSRLEVLAHAVARRENLIRRVPVDERDDLLRFDMYDVRIIGHDHGQPIIRFADGRYDNDRLRASKRLIGRSVLVMANSRKLRKVYAVLEDGTSLGELTCERRFSHTEFSIETIRDIKRLGKDSFGSGCDDIPRAFRQAMEIAALESARAARILLRLQHEQSEANANNEVASANTAGTGDTDPDDFLSEDGLDEQLIREAQETLKGINTQYR